MAGGSDSGENPEVKKLGYVSSIISPSLHPTADVAIVENDLIKPTCGITQGQSSNGDACYGGRGPLFGGGSPCCVFEAPDLMSSIYMPSQGKK